MADEATALLSIVVPAYNEADSLPALCQRIADALGEETRWELIVVSDGSTDHTWKVLDRLHAKDSRIRGIHLLINSGHMKALAAGIDRAAGDLVITMDADLQHPPEVIPEIVRKWREG